MKLPTSYDDHEDVDELGPSFIGLQLYQLLSIINIQGSRLLSDLNLQIPSRIASSLMLLKMHGPMSVTQLGRKLNMTHQLMAHRMKLMKELHLIVEERDPSDKRRILFLLTDKGNLVTTKLQEVSRRASEGYADLYEEIGIDLYDALIKARMSLLRKPLYERIKQQS